MTGANGVRVTGRSLQTHQAREAEHQHAAPAASAGHLGLPSRPAMTAWFAAFTVYAGVTILTGHADGTWAAWACGGYAVTTILLLVTRSWVVPLTAAVGGTLIAPLLWLITKAAPTGEVVVISQSASYLLKHGTPYLPQSLLTSWTSYNPYLPFMEIFGLPRSAGLAGVLGDPRIWTTLVTISALAVAFTVVSPHRIRDCRQCRSRVAWLTTVATVSPVIAFPLSVGVTDPPVIALTCLTLALAYRGKLVMGGPGARAGLRDEDHGLGGDPGDRGHGVGSVLTARRRPVHRRRDRADSRPRRCGRAGRPGERSRGQRGQAELDRLPAGHRQVHDPGPESAPRPPHRRARPGWPYRRGGADGDRGGGVRRVASAAPAARRPRCRIPPRGRLRGPVHPGPVHPVRLLRLPAGPPRLAGPDTIRDRSPGVPLADRPDRPGRPTPPPAPDAVRSRAASSPGRRVGWG